MVYGQLVGLEVGLMVVSWIDGLMVGLEVGLMVGLEVGLMVGLEVGLMGWSHGWWSAG